MADSQDYQPGQPGAEYTRRLELNQRSRDQLHRRHIWIGNARVALFVAIVALCWIIGRTRRPSLYWLLAAVAGFIVLAAVHRRVLRGKAHCERALAFYQRGVARLQDRWAGTGDKGEQFRDPDHIYADDLDIFGEGSLFELLCVARSRMGKEKLADWLLRQSDFDTVRERHRAVLELKEKIDFREVLALAGKTAAIQADPAKLKSWAATFPRFDNKKWQVWAALLTAISLAALGFVVDSYVRTGEALWTPFLLTLVINGSVLFAFRHPLDSIF
ncbi:MAG TPA: DNA mismatch repair protein MutS, partial [Candidatus Angelobacter sp.]|nr:DNA mismatch repair protein MutS [Candidatus Angelobacter sp.]